MQYLTSCVTDVGTTKNCNQDSVILSTAEFKGGGVCLAAICDGMGGLAKGELASATAAGALDEWFKQSLPLILNSGDITQVTSQIQTLASELNERIGSYGHDHRVNLGTTLTALVFIEDTYGIVHIGDCGAYLARDGSMKLLTKDQTLVQREVDKGLMTAEEARVDPRRNVILQCIGASKVVLPEIITGKADKGDIFMLCSDGFRHELSDSELRQALFSDDLASESGMNNKLLELVDTCKNRGETDNISVALVKMF